MSTIRRTLVAGVDEALHRGAAKTLYYREGVGPVVFRLGMTGEETELYPGQGIRMPDNWADSVVAVASLSGPVVVELTPFDVIDNRGSLVIADTLPPSRMNGEMVYASSGEEVVPGTWRVTIPADPQRRRVIVSAPVLYDITASGVIYVGCGTWPVVPLMPGAVWEADYSGPLCIWMQDEDLAVMVGELLL